MLQNILGYIILKHLHQKQKADQHNRRAAGSFNWPYYTSDDGQLDRNV
jgi:hypothetical protein